MDLDQAWEYPLLTYKRHTINWVWRACRVSCCGLGSPEQDLEVVHVAGTNGKGSVGAAVAAILHSSGLTCGHYTSPHLLSVLERFAIDGRLLSEQEFALGMSRIQAMLGQDRITYFEAILRSPCVVCQTAGRYGSA